MTTMMRRRVSGWIRLADGLLHSQQTGGQEDAVWNQHAKHPLVCVQEQNASDHASG
jgi:hypothetical protein